MGLIWPLASWCRYVASRPALADAIDWSFPLTFLVRGDGYPVAGSSWTQLSVSLVNFLGSARSPAFVGVLGLAMCAEKHSQCIGEIWGKLFKVRPMLCSILHVQCVQFCCFSRTLDACLDVLF